MTLPRCEARLIHFRKQEVSLEAVKPTRTHSNRSTHNSTAAGGRRAEDVWARPRCPKVPFTRRRRRQTGPRATANCQPFVSHASTPLAWHRAPSYLRSGVTAIWLCGNTRVLAAAKDPPLCASLHARTHTHTLCTDQAISAT